MPGPNDQRLQPQGLRAINGQLQKADAGEGNKYTLSFSSEEPYLRWGFPEILDHTQGAVDLSRLNDIGVLLFNHDTRSILGKVITASIENNRGVATVEWDGDEFASGIREKVDNGTLKGVSVRYRVDSWEEVRAGAVSADGRFTGPCDIARNWTPLEISIVTIPADPTVGVGRSEEEIEKEEQKEMTVSKTVETPTPATQDQVVVPEQQRGASDPILSREEIVGIERQRVADITDLCREFDLDPAKHIEAGTTLDEVRSAVLEELKKSHAPVAMVIKDEGDKFREAAVDGLLLRSGLPVKNEAAGAQQMRNLRIRDLMNTCARQEGIANPEMLPIEDLMRQFFSPSAAFPAILDQTVQKAYVAGYETYPATFEQWTGKGQLSDFKPSKYNYTMGNAGEFLLIPEGGEVKHDTVATHLRPERQLRTWGRQFTLTREAIYNDDIGLVTTIPARYASAARKTINRQVYSVLGLNPVIFNGNNLFSAAHGNLITPGTAPSLKALQVAMNMMALMKNEEDELIYVVPRYVIVPIGLGDTFRELLGTKTLVVESSNSTITTQANPLHDRGLVIIEDPVLNTVNANGAIEWYLAADRTSITTIQVDYLNGNEIPTIRRMEYPGQLGYIWDIILDWGVTVMDYRGIIKNLGSA